MAVALSWTMQASGIGPKKSVTASAVSTSVTINRVLALWHAVFASQNDNPGYGGLVTIADQGGGNYKIYIQRYGPNADNLAKHLIDDIDAIEAVLTAEDTEVGTTNTETTGTIEDYGSGKITVEVDTP